MDVAYRAEDTNLSRKVAIKVLPEQFTQDSQRPTALKERQNSWPHSLTVFRILNSRIFPVRKP